MENVASVQVSSIQSAHAKASAYAKATADKTADKLENKLGIGKRGI